MSESSATPATASQRDNNVYSAGVGTAIDFTGLLFGEAVVGWAMQEFDDSQFRQAVVASPMA